MIDVTEYLRFLLGRSTPGDTLHHLLIASSEPNAVTPLGTPSESELAIALYAIDYVTNPDGPGNANQYIADVIRAAIAETHQKGNSIHFAGIAIEVHMGAADVRGVPTKHAQRRLYEHPDAFESTILYAAARDGRRWAGCHFLTGPKAGTINGPSQVTGDIQPYELSSHQVLIRSAVGLRT